MTGTIASTSTLRTQTPTAIPTSIHAIHHSVFGVGWIAEPAAITGGSACSSGSGVSCWEDSSVNTQMSLGGLAGDGQPGLQTAGYSVSNIGDPTRGAASISPMIVFAS